MDTSWRKLLLLLLLLLLSLSFLGITVLLRACCCVRRGYYPHSGLAVIPKSRRNLRRSVRISERWQIVSHRGTHCARRPASDVTLTRSRRRHQCLGQQQQQPGRRLRRAVIMNAAEPGTSHATVYRHLPTCTQSVSRSSCVTFSMYVLCTVRIYTCSVRTRCHPNRSGRFQ